ncbi:hypothetical protein PFISCL1PPCAC_3334, partial [Pristionchus fissidentatus]
SHTDTAVSCRSADYAVRRPLWQQLSRKAPSVHWAEDMDGGSEFDLKDQIKRAKEMGYTDEAVYEALRRNKRNGDLLYSRFADMNSMLDLLNKSHEQQEIKDQHRKEREEAAGAISHSSSTDSNYSPSCDRSSISGRGSSTLSLDQRPAAPMK